MTGTTQTLTGTFGTTDFLMPLVLDDLTDEDARERSRGEEGPSIAWMVGHLLHYRHYVMGLLGGEERDNPYAERFADAGATDGADYPTVAELREQWGATATDFQALLTSKTEPEFDQAKEGAHDERSLRDQVAFFAWHEGYHMGALGAQLKAMGYMGPAEKVMAAREAEA